MAGVRTEDDVDYNDDGDAGFDSASEGETGASCVVPEAMVRLSSVVLSLPSRPES